MSLWAVAWSGLMPVSEIELVEAETAEEALEMKHREITERYDAGIRELCIEKVVPRGEP